jgi:hypothetical protein
MEKVGSEFGSYVNLETKRKKDSKIMNGFKTLISKDQVIEIFKEVRKDKKHEML